MKYLSIENLTKIGACKGGIALVKFANLQHYDLCELDIEGDVRNYVSWLNASLSWAESKYEPSSVLDDSEYTCTYYDNGNILTRTNGYGSTWVYDIHGNIISYTKAGVLKWTRTFDSNGNMLTHVDPIGYSSTYTYNEMNDILTYVSSSGIWYSYTYSKEGLVLTYISDIASSSYEYLTDVPGYLLVVKENGEEILTVKLKS